MSKQWITYSACQAIFRQKHALICFHLFEGGYWFSLKSATM